MRTPVLVVAALACLTGCTTIENRPKEEANQSKAEVRVPKMLSGDKFIYPPYLLKEKVEGQVVIELVIDEAGNVIDLDVISSTHEGFTYSVLYAATTWVFEAPLNKGVPQKARYRMTIPFKL